MAGDRRQGAAEARIRLQAIASMPEKGRKRLDIAEG
jgi:hypothetical protein